MKPSNANKRSAMRRRGMTVRRWLMTAAIVVLPLAAWRCMQRRAYYLARVARCAPLVRLYSIRTNETLDDGTYILNRTFFDEDGQMNAEIAAEFEEQYAYYAGLMRKYRYAASHPWLSVEPDAPQPD